MTWSLSVRTRAGTGMLSCIAVLLWCTAGRPSAQSGVPVQWTNLVNATASSNSIHKTAGCSDCSDAGGTSVQSIASGDGHVEFTPLFGGRLFAGLGSTQSASADPALIEYAFGFWPDGGWDVRERGVYKFEGRFAEGHVFRIALVGGAVTYYHNGVLVYSSLVPSSLPLVLDTTLISAGAALNAAVITGQDLPPQSVPVTIGTTSLPDATATQTYSAELQAAGGSGIFAWTVTGGALPAGLALTQAGTISGIPVAGGVFTFTVRAADTGEAGNFAERALTLRVSVVNAVTIATTTLSSSRIGATYSAPLNATGGSGAYSWSVVAGALPGGLLLDPSSGAIQGTATAGGRFDVTVRAVDAVDTALFDDQPLALSVLAAAPPSAYDAIVDREPRAKGALPLLAGAGFVFGDPIFGTRMLRVTDGATRPVAPNRSYRTPSGTHTNAWSADGRLFYATSTDGTAVPFAFDQATMHASRLAPSADGDGGLTLRFFNEPTFSYLTPGVAYGTYSGANLRSVDQYDFRSGQYSQLLDLDSLVGGLAGTYTGGLGNSAGDVERLFAFFGGTSQDRHFYLVVFDKLNPANRWLLDTVASTVDGQPANITLDFKIHAAAIDRSGRYVTVYPTGGDLQAPRSAAPAYVWDLLANSFTATPLVAAISGGHDAYGFGYRVNQDCCTSSTWDAAQWQLRSLAAPLESFDLITPVLLPKEIYLADHPSWHNAQEDRLVPFIDATYRYGANTTAWRPWDEEIFAVQTDGAGGGASVWRFAHHRSAVADDVDPTRISFWNTPRANVSPDGRWALFTSNWEKTLGTDDRSEAGGRNRQDVFLVELARSAIVAVPVLIGTTAVPSGTVSQPYAVTLQAGGGSGSFSWSVAAGSLPAGLTLNTATGVIAGTPAAAGTSTFTVRASDAADTANEDDQTLTIAIVPAPAVPVVITTTSLPDARRGIAYTTTLAVAGGQTPLNWSKAAGTLPPGLNLNAATGTITGTALSTGTWSFTVRVADSAAPSSADTQVLSLRVRKRNSS
jgi:hypothetical protein